jgi:hypothetical protein
MKNIASIGSLTDTNTCEMITTGTGSVTASGLTVFTVST